MHRTDVSGINRRVMAMLVAVSLAGCASNGEEGKLSNREKGAIIGAVSGAVIGKSTANHKDKRAVIGAILGGVAGAMVGEYMDRQEMALRKELEATGIGVSRNGNNISLHFPDKITFDVGQSTLKPQLQPVLNDVAGVLGEFDQTIVNIHGHTDSSGSDAFNQTLSEQRADSVRRYLAMRGLNDQRLLPQGFGESQPVASNDSAYGRAENRRVEIILEPVVKD